MNTTGRHGTDAGGARPFGGTRWRRRLAAGVFGALGLPLAALAAGVLAGATGSVSTATMTVAVGGGRPAATAVMADGGPHTVAFTYTAGAAAALTGGSWQVTLPSGWSATGDSTTCLNGASKAATLTPSSGAVAGGGTVDVSNVTLAAGTSCSLTLTGVTATAGDTPATFAPQDTNGTLTSPTVQVVAADGSGTLAVSPALVSAGSSPTLTFSYTPAVGGLDGGTLELGTPTGWSFPTAVGDVSLATGKGCAATVGPVTATTIELTGVTATSTGSCELTVSGTTAPSAPSTTSSSPSVFRAKEQSGANGSTLTAVAASAEPSVVVAPDGAGTLSLGSVTPSTASVAGGDLAAGATGVTLPFTYTAGPDGMSDGSIAFVAPAGWAAPSATSGAAGHTTTSCPSTAGAATVDAATRSITWTGVTLTAGATCTITYADVTVPTPTGSPTPPTVATFEVQQASSPSGTPATSSALEPAASVVAPDGSGSFTAVALDGHTAIPVTAGTAVDVPGSSTLKTLAVTYTAAAGGLSGGAIEVTLPAGWSGGTTGATATCSTSVSDTSGTVVATGVTLAGGTTCTITLESVVTPTATATATTYTLGGGEASASSTPVAFTDQAKQGLELSVVAPDGSGSFTAVAFDGHTAIPVTAGQAVAVPGSSLLSTLSVTYTAAPGGLSGGSIEVTLPAGWSGGTTGATSTCSSSVTAAGGSVVATGVTLAAGSTCTITLGSVVSPNPTATPTTYTLGGGEASASSTPVAFADQAKQGLELSVVAPDGSGSFTAGPAAVSGSPTSAGATAPPVTLTYTAATGGTVDGTLDITLPSGWSTTSSTAGTTTCEGGTATPVTVSGGPIDLSGVTLAGGATCTVTLSGLVPPTVGPTTAAITSVFTADESSTAVPLDTTKDGLPAASEASVAVVSPDGSGSVAVSPAAVDAGSGGNTLTFTYTPADAGTVDGQLAVDVPTGWSTPTAGASGRGAVTATCGAATPTVSVVTVTSGADKGESRILVNGVTAGGASGPATCTITYHDATASAAVGAAASNFAVSEQSTADHNLMALAGSPYAVAGDSTPVPAATTFTGAANSGFTFALDVTGYAGSSGSTSLSFLTGDPATTTGATTTATATATYTAPAATGWGSATLTLDGVTAPTADGATLTATVPSGGTVEGGVYTFWVQAANAVGTDVFPVTVELDSAPTFAAGTTTCPAGSGSPASIDPSTGVTLPVGSPAAQAACVAPFAYPVPAVSEAVTGPASINALPTGVFFADLGNGTGELTGTPAAGTPGTYDVTLQAESSSGTTTESFTLTVDQAPQFSGTTTVPVTLGPTGGSANATVDVSSSPLPSTLGVGGCPVAGCTVTAGSAVTSTSVADTEAFPLSVSLPPGTGSGDYPVQLSVTAAGVTATETLHIEVTASPGFVSKAVDALIPTGQPDTVDIQTSGSAIGYVCLATTGNGFGLQLQTNPAPGGDPPLASGCAYVDGSGTVALSGTPTVAGHYSTAVYGCAAGAGATSCDASNAADTATLDVNIVQPPSFSPAVSAGTLQLAPSGASLATTTSSEVTCGKLSSLPANGLTVPLVGEPAESWEPAGTCTTVRVAAVDGQTAAAATDQFDIAYGQDPTSGAAPTTATLTTDATHLPTPGTHTVTLEASYTPTLDNSGTTPQTFTATETVDVSVEMGATLSIPGAGSTGSVDIPPVDPIGPCPAGSSPGCVQYAVTATGYPAPSLAVALAGGAGAPPSYVQLTGESSGGCPQAPASTVQCSTTATLQVQPPADATPGLLPLVVTASTGSGTPASTVHQDVTVGLAQPYAVTSPASAQWEAGTANSFTVTETGYEPGAPGTLTVLGAPAWMTVTTGSGTATLSGIPPADSSGGPIDLPVYADYVPGGTNTALQTLVIDIDAPLAFTSAGNATFQAGVAGSFAVTTSGYPAATSVTETGALPAGVHLTSSGTGATLAGTPPATATGTYPITFSATDGTTTVTQSFTLAVDDPVTIISPPPGGGGGSSGGGGGSSGGITSPSTVTFVVGTTSSFTIRTTGTPTPALTETGALPSGVTFVAGGDGTALLAGDPAAGSGGTYPLTITASDGGAEPTATQKLTVVVEEKPAFTTGASASFSAGADGSFTITASGSPAPSLSESGALPAGLTFSAAAGSATIAGTPLVGAGGVYDLRLEASNVVGKAAQTLVVAVRQAPLVQRQPRPVTVAEGGTARFSAAASGGPVPAVAWQVSSDGGSRWTSLPRATATTLVVADVSSGQQGDEYRAEFTNASSKTPVFSAPATLDVRAVGYWLADAAGHVRRVGGVGFFGSPVSRHIHGAAVVGVAGTPDGRGYWVATATGAVYAFGDATAYPSLAQLGVTVRDVVGITALPFQHGYWLVTATGNVYGFGLAKGLGTLASRRLRVDDVVGLAPTPDGRGYWIATATGQVVGFGDAGAYGSLPSRRIRLGDVVGVAAGPGGRGYWLLTRIGQVFGFGTAAVHGSPAAQHVRLGDAVALVGTPDAGGYGVVTATGQVFHYGDAPTASVHAGGIRAGAAG